MKKKINDYILHYKKIINENENKIKNYAKELIDVIKEKKEKLEKLRDKLYICIEKNDLSEISEDYKNITKTNR